MATSTMEKQHRNKSYRFFEINDQDWFPNLLRDHVQRTLTFFWCNRLPLIQKVSPAAVVARILRREVRGDYTFLDFCSGAGGPIGEVACQLNNTLEIKSADSAPKKPFPVKFLVSDIHPNIESWISLEKRSHGQVSYISSSLDATNASCDAITSKLTEGAKSFRTFFLAFHHFDDNGAVAVLQDALQKSDGIGIFELQNRSLPAIILVLLMFPLLLLVTPFYSSLHAHFLSRMFFTYALPVIPFVMVFDGIVSSIRTRPPKEVYRLAKIAASSGVNGSWEWSSGQDSFFWPLGKVFWTIGRVNNAEQTGYSSSHEVRGILPNVDIPHQDRVLGK